MSTVTLLEFIAWVAKNAPSFINDIRLLVNSFCNETGRDSIALLRDIDADDHKKVDSEIDAKIEKVYAEVEKTVPTV